MLSILYFFFFQPITVHVSFKIGAILTKENGVDINGIIKKSH